MMSTVFVDVLIALSTMLFGAIVSLRLSKSYFRKKEKHLRLDNHHAAKVLVHLQELAARIVGDVDRHNDRVEEINSALIVDKIHESKTLTDVVAKLIQANQQMQEQLASSENKLREQAKEIQVHAAEARTDPLTHLANRRAFDDELSRRCAEFSRQGNPFSLIMTDVDYFKEFNDKYGHLIGDEVLRGVSRILRRKMREMDFVARYGGEEFAIILPGTNLAEAEIAAHRACEGMEKSRFSSEGKEFCVTMSFGVAQMRDRENGPVLIGRADKALFAAKEAGRNCVYRHDGEAIRRSTPSNQPASFPAGSPNVKTAAKQKAEKTLPTHNNPKLEQQLTQVVPQKLYNQLDIPSRSTFCGYVRNRTVQWKRGGPLFSVILFEVNQYCIDSKIRLQQAHKAAMQAACKYLASAACEIDVIGQYGPGCLGMLLPESHLAHAIQIAERIREGFSLCDLGTEEMESQLKMSIGVAQIMNKDDSISLLSRAEEALAAADRRGGDRTYFHDGVRCAPITAMMETMDYLS